MMITKLFRTFLLLFCGTQFLMAQSDSLITFSEIMFWPSAASSEFVELYNLSTSESIDLAGFQIQYHTSPPDFLLETGGGSILPPESYAVIFEGDYDLLNGIYSGLIPDGTLILKVDDNAFGSSGLSNSSSRTIRLLNNVSDTVEVYEYTANNSAGLSDEKIFLSKNNSSQNWANALSINGTPGFKNSVSPLQFDLAVSKIFITPENPVEGDDIQITGRIKNNGSDDVFTYTVELFNDANMDSVGQPNELLSSTAMSSLSTNDSAEVSVEIFNVEQGAVQIIASVLFNEDENPVDNLLIQQFTVLPKPAEYNDIVLNEIMYSPTDGEPEWIEIYNRSQRSINLFGWQIFDAASSSNLSDTLTINPNEFVVVADDTSITNFYEITSRLMIANLPSLNNSGDEIVLKDAAANSIDSLEYLPDWGGTNGKSLERLNVEGLSHDKNNWASSEDINNATPGLINSVTPKGLDVAISRIYSNSNYAFMGEDFKIHIIAKNKGTEFINNFEVSIFHDVNMDSTIQAGELLTNFNWNNLAPDDSIEFEYNFPVTSAGLNFLITEAILEGDEYPANNKAFFSFNVVEINEQPGDLIVNEIMYAPQDGEPEWIEIYNRSTKIIDLKNYNVGDSRDTVKILFNSLLLYPDEYFVIAKDSSIFNYYSSIENVVISSFPTLNNSEDAVVFIDSLNRIIDSVYYFSVWGGADGKSLERISSEENSNNPDNWGVSLNPDRGTPGIINSLTQKEFDVLVDEIIFNPKFPLQGDTVSVSAKCKNIGKEVISFELNLYEDQFLDSANFILLEQLNNLTIQPGDSSIYPFNFLIKNLIMERAFAVEAAAVVDEDTTNNYSYKKLAPGFAPGVIVINEAMFRPGGDEPEWVELFNRSEIDINIKGWQISDVVTTPVSKIIYEEDLIIPAKSYLVISKSLSIKDYHRLIPSTIVELNFANLNNDEDGIVIKDERGLTIDSLFYTNSFNTKSGYSLERKSVEEKTNYIFNWQFSEDIEQSTPGRINSITEKEYDLSIASVSTMPRFPLPGDNVFINVQIKNNGTATAENATVNFFTYNNGQLNSVGENLLSPIGIRDSVFVKSSDSIILNDSLLIAAKINFIYDLDTLNNYVEKIAVPGYAEGLILINEFLANPINGEPEWIEFINVSEEPVNLLNWKISDLLPLPTIGFITSDSAFINPDEIFLITSNKNYFEYLEDVKIFETDFGSLSNSSDGIILYDFRNAIIDSLKYESDWVGAKGISLERISIEKNSSEKSNWSHSLAESGSTPGLPNSLISISPSSRNNIVINEIMFEPYPDNSEFIELHNLSGTPIELGGWTITDDEDNFYKLTESSFTILPDDFFIIAADSSIIFNFNFLKDYKNKTIVNESSLGLVNNGEAIILKDLFGNIIDSVFYNDKWHNQNISITKNKSLERLNPGLNSNDASNWSTSVNELGGTPGKKNSIYTKGIFTESKISVSPNPFSPDNDGFEDFTVINYNLTQPIAQMRVKVYDSKGRLRRTLINNQSTGASGSIIFDGLDDSGNPLRIGIYILFIEAMNPNSGIIDELKEVVVVARKL